MRKVLQIFHRDIRRLMHNWVAMIVMAGVCILPSLYAWFNIAANMDPYGNTQGIKVAIANEDEGATNELMKLEAGNKIVASLRQNKKLGWTFVESTEALKGVESGEYYAAIIIPTDFSSSLLSVMSGELKAPKLVYYINEKKNAVAPKITDTGAGTIEQEIDNTFSSVAAASLLNTLSTAAMQVTGRVNSMSTDILSMIQQTSDNLEQYKTIQTNFQNTVSGSSTVINDTKGTLDAVDTAAANGSTALTNASGVLNKGRTDVGAFSSAFSETFSNGETLLNQVQSAASTDLSNLEAQAIVINGNLTLGLNSAQEVLDLNGAIIQQLTDLNNSNPDGVNADITAIINQLTADHERHQTVLNELTAGNASIANTIQTASDTRQSLETLLVDSQTNLRNFRTSYETELLPELNQTLDTCSTLLGELSGVLSGVSPSTSQLRTILDQLNTNLTQGVEALSTTGTALTGIGTKLNTITADLNAIKSSDTYENLLKLEGIDSDAIADFISSPVEIKTENLYSVKNYGSSMTPFYTNLAIWVGGIVLIAILKLEADKDEKVSEFTAIQSYFGRWLLFIVLGLIQATIVCLGDIYLLKTQCLNPAAFICTGILSSFVYVNIIYALSITFKHIGKAVCVILVILQIPGSAGTYPIEMTPEFFQKLHPLLPFTYSISAMREAIAGFYKNQYAINMGMLLIFVVVALLIGLGIRPLLLNLNRLFDKKLSETEIMISESGDSVSTDYSQRRLMLQALLGNEPMRAEITKKAEAFESHYEKRIKLGFLAILIIPLIFLILMFSLESRIVFLVLWIVSIIIIAVYLIFTEYVHDKLTNQLRLADKSSEELLKEMTDKEAE